MIRMADTFSRDPQGSALLNGHERAPLRVAAKRV